MVYFHAILMMLIAISELVLGFYVYLKNRGNEFRFWFLMISIGLFIWVGTLGIDLIVFNNKLIIAIGYLPWIGAMVIVTSLLFFSWVWPFKTQRITRFHWAIFILPNIIFTFLILSPLAPVVDKTQSDLWRSNPPGPAYGFYNFVICIFIIWSFINLISKYHRADGVHRWQIKYILIGLGISGFFILLTNVMMPWLKISIEFVQSAIGPEISIIWFLSIIYVLFKKTAST